MARPLRVAISRPKLRVSRETVEVLDSGHLVLSTGPVHDPSGQLISRFTSIWRREAPGQWRIIFDKGNRVCPSPAGAEAAEE